MATSSSSRKQSYSVLIDAIPPSAIVISFLLFLGAVFASLSVLFFAPPVEEFVYERLTPETRESEGSTFRHLFNGGYNLVADTEHRVNKSNQEVSFALLLRESNLLQGLKKSDVYLELSVTGKKSKDDDFGEPFRVTQRHRRTLDCTSADYFCEPIVVFRQRYIEYPYYRISVKFLNLDEVYQRGFLDDVLFTRFEYTNPEYTVFESTMRTIFLGVSTVVFAFYITSLYWSQELKFWKTEQRWIAVLLLALIGFNNPFFIGEWAGESWFFPFLNIFFQTTFGAVFLLFLLVISHSALVAPAKRGFVFYATKILLVIVLWALVLMVGCWERFNEFYDPSVEITEIPFFGSIRVAIVAISIIVLIMISYYTIKAIGGEDLVESTITVLGENSAQTLQFQSQSSRFKVFFMLTFLVVLTLAADYLTFVMFDYANNAAQYLSLFPIINYYAILLAIYFLPSNQIESGGNILIEPGTFKSAKAKKREMIDFDRQSVPESPVNTTDSASEQTSPTNRTY